MNSKRFSSSKRNPIAERKKDRDDFFSGFGGGLMQSFGFFDLESEMFGRGGFFSGQDLFGNAKFFGRKMAEDSVPGSSFVSKSYSYSRSIGQDGKPVELRRVKNERAVVDRKGRKVREREEVDLDFSNGVKRVTKERQLNDKKVKVTKEVRNDERNVYREFENLEEEEAEDFHREWSKEAGRMKLKSNGLEALPRLKPKKTPKQRMIGY